MKKVVVSVIKQKFHKGDYVKAVWGGPAEDAVVIGSYADQYGGYSQHCHSEYTVSTREGGRCSWYSDNQLTLIEHGRLDLLKKWDKEREQDAKQKSDLDWIFSHGSEVLERKYGASIQALANCFGVTNLWGSSGEGITYYENSVTTLQYAYEFLVSGDKQGWLERAKEIEVVIAEWRSKKSHSNKSNE